MKKWLLALMICLSFSTLTVGLFLLPHTINVVYQRGQEAEDREAEKSATNYDRYDWTSTVAVKTITLSGAANSATATLYANSCSAVYHNWRNDGGITPIEYSFQNDDLVKSKKVILPDIGSDYIGNVVHFAKISLSGTTTRTYSAWNTTDSSYTMPTRRSYTFSGYWSSSSGGTQYITATGSLTAAGRNSVSYGASGSTTWYAQWAQNNTLITLYPNTTAPDSVTIAKDTWLSSFTLQVSPSGKSQWKSISASYTYTGSEYYVPSGWDIRFTATCKSGYAVWKIEYNSSRVWPDASGYYTITSLSSSTSGTYYFYPLAGYKVSVTAGTGGTVQHQTSSPKMASISGGVKSSTSFTATSGGNWYVSNWSSYIDIYARANTGYTFDYFSPSDSSGTVTSSKSIYAYFKANKYSITLNPNGATGGTTSNQTIYAMYNNSGLYANSTLKDYTSATITAPTRNGYTFGGWVTSSGVNQTNTVIINSSGSLTASNGYTNSSRQWTSTSSPTLYAKWTAISYTITYSAGGGSFASGVSSTQSYTIVSNSTLYSSSSVTKAGYIFNGWKASNVNGNWSNGGVYSAGASLNGNYGNLTLTAQWTGDSYTLTFNGNGGQADIMQLKCNLDGSFESYSSGTSIGLQDQTGGSTFTVSTDYVAAGSRSLKVGYTSGSNNRFYSIGGLLSGTTYKFMSKVYIPSSSSISSIQMHTEKYGGNYTNWSGVWSSSTSTKGSWVTLSCEETSPVTSDTNLYAFFNVSGSGTFYIDDWQIFASKTNKTVTNGSSYSTLPTAVRTGYTFNGWAKNLLTGGGGGNNTTYNNGSVTTGSQNVDTYFIFNQEGMVNGETYVFEFDAQLNSDNDWHFAMNNDASYGAYIKKGNNQIVFVYNSNWGGVLFDDYAIRTPSDPLTISNVVCYKQGTYITSSTTVSTARDHELAGVWTINSYTLTAYANSGSISSTSGWSGTGSSATKSVNYSAKYNTLPTVSRSNYSLKGWYTSSSGGSTVSTETMMGASNARIYAQWNAIGRTITLKGRIVGKNGTVTNADNLGGSVLTGTYTSVSSGSTGSGTINQSANTYSYTMHQGSTLTITPTVASGYKYLGYSTSATSKPTVNSFPTSSSITVPSADTTYYLYFQQVAAPLYYTTERGGYWYYEDGEYPQTYVGSSLSGASATGSTFNINGTNYTVYSLGASKYIQVASPMSGTIKFNGQTVTLASGTKYWFRIDPIRWRVSKYGASASAYSLASATSNLVGVSDILGYGRVNTTTSTYTQTNLKSENLSAYTQTCAAVGYTNAATNMTYTFDQLSGDGTSSKTTTYTKSITQASTLTVASLSDIQKAAHNGTAQENLQTYASDLSAMLQCRDYNNSTGWTSSIYNIGSGIAVGPGASYTGKYWANTDNVFGFVYAHQASYATCLGGGLPSGYTKMSYIQSNGGGPAIGTGFKPNQDTRIVADIVTNSTTTDMYNLWYGGATSSGVGMEGYAWSGVYDINYATNSANFGAVTYGNRIVIDQNKNVTTVYDLTAGSVTNYTNSYSTWQSDSGLILFGICRGGQWTFSYGSIKIYGFKVYDNGYLVRDLIPVKNSSNNYGMYDIIGQQYYSATGPYSFTGG